MRGLAWTMAPLAMAMSACGGDTGDKGEIAEKVEQRADTQADAIEERSESIDNKLQQNAVEQQADMVRKAGEERADAIRNSQLESDVLTDQQKNELIEGK